LYLIGIILGPSWGLSWGPLDFLLRPPGGLDRGRRSATWLRFCGIFFTRQPLEGTGKECTRAVGIAGSWGGVQERRGESAALRENPRRRMYDHGPPGPEIFEGELLAPVYDLDRPIRMLMPPRRNSEARRACLQLSRSCNVQGIPNLSNFSIFQPRRNSETFSPVFNFQGDRSVCNRARLPFLGRTSVPKKRQQGPCVSPSRARRRAQRGPRVPEGAPPKKASEGEPSEPPQKCFRVTQRFPKVWPRVPKVPEAHAKRVGSETCLR